MAGAAGAASGGAHALPLGEQLLGVVLRHRRLHHLVHDGRQDPLVVTRPELAVQLGQLLLRVRLVRSVVGLGVALEDRAVQDSDADVDLLQVLRRRLRLDELWLRLDIEHGRLLEPGEDEVRAGRLGLRQDALRPGPSAEPLEQHAALAAVHVEDAVLLEDVQPEQPRRRLPRPRQRRLDHTHQQAGSAAGAELAADACSCRAVGQRSAPPELLQFLPGSGRVADAALGQGFASEWQGLGCATRGLGKRPEPEPLAFAEPAEGMT